MNQVTLDTSDAISPGSFQIDDFFRSTGLAFDLSRALLALAQVNAQYPLSDQRRQLSLMHRSSEKQSVDDGVGSLFDYQTKKWLAHEDEFRFFSNEFRETYFFEIYERLDQWAEGRIRRIRLMYLPPRACYSMHQDPSIRYHLALETNGQAFFIFLNGLILNIPADGQIYRLDTRHFHTAMNGSEKPRIHLVFSERE